MSDAKPDGSGFGRRQIERALVQSVRKLDPVYLLKTNVIMLIVEVTAVITAAMALDRSAFSGLTTQPQWIYVALTVILLLTVWFATLAESISEIQGQARVDSLRRLEQDVQARKVVDDVVTVVPSKSLVPGDVVRLRPPEIVPRDGVVLEGMAFLDESLMTGESAPVVKKVGDPLIGGTTVSSDALVMRIVAESGRSYLDDMIKLVEGAHRPRSPNETSLNLLLIGLTGIFVLVVGSFLVLADSLGFVVDLAILLSFLVALMPTTVGGLLPAIGIAGITRVGRANVIAKSGKAVEAAGDVDTLILDKTGTITQGQRSVRKFVPLEGFTEADVAQAAFLASALDRTPEGRSVVEVATANGHAIPLTPRILAGKAIDFSAETRLSGVELLSNFGSNPARRPEFPRVTPEVAQGPVWAKLVSLEESGAPDRVIKGAVDAVLACATDVNTAELLWKAQEISKQGGTPLAVAVGSRVFGLIDLRDQLKPGIKERLAAIEATGIRTVMVTGDTEITARVIAAEAGISDVISQAKPADKLKRVEQEQAQAHIVGVEGDGTNDAPALAKADVGIAMNSGTAAAREAANMIDLDSDPSKVTKVVQTGKELLMTRGAITTFSVTNDVSKYFALFPAMLPASAAAQKLNILQLHSPATAILATMIFNAAVIPALIPLSFRGVKFRPELPERTFLRNMAVYGVGGAILPFVAIKGIDILLTWVIH
jgi:potassium-transporting ATPase ATP-binding subunit